MSRVIISVGLVLTALATLGHTAAHAGTVYSLSNTLSGTSGQNGWTVAGTIELQDNTVFGAISSSDIKSWQWTLTKLGSTTLSADSLTGSVYLLSDPEGLIATATGLYYDQNSREVTFGLYNSDGTKTLAWKNMAFVAASFEANDYDGSPAQLFNVFPANFPTSLDGQYYQFATPFAAPSSVPEIDPATGGSALSLVAGVLAMIEQRRRRGLSTALTA